MATEKQIKWRVRGRTLFGIRGITSRSSIADSMCLTQRERELLREAFNIIQDVVDNSTESSRELGFNAVERCKYCGKPATHEGLCEKCYNMVNY